MNARNNEGRLCLTTYRKMIPNEKNICYPLLLALQEVAVKIVMYVRWVSNSFSSRLNLVKGLITCLIFPLHYN